MLNRLSGSLAAFALIHLMLQAQTPKPTRDAMSDEKISPTVAQRIFIKNWKIIDLEGLLGAGLEGGRNFDKGHDLFHQATCTGCHRFKQEGSVLGPDLSLVANKYGPSELLAHIIEPSKEISDAQGQHELTMRDGGRILGRIVNLTSDKVTLSTNMRDPKAVQSIDRKLIKSMEPSKVSMMPSDLLHTLNEMEILDLLAYLLSKGEREDPMFR